MSDTRFCDLSRLNAEANPVLLDLPSADQLYEQDQTTVTTEHYPEVRVTEALPYHLAARGISKRFELLALGHLGRHWQALSWVEAARILDEAQTIRFAAAALVDWLAKAIDAAQLGDVEDCAYALGQAQQYEADLVGVDIVDEIGEQLIARRWEPDEAEDL